MQDAIRFLHSLAQAMSTLALYSPGHPAAEKAAGTLWQSLTQLLKDDPEPQFYFLATTPVYNGRAIHELADWTWSERLADAGVRRLEFERDATPASLLDFLREVSRRLAAAAPVETLPDETRYPGIRFGRVSVLDPFAEDGDAEVEESGEPESRELALDLTDELDAVAFLFVEAARGRVARSEADAVVRILGAHLDRHELPQAAPPPDHEAYPQVHAVNSALLAMAVATAAGIDAPGRHRIGVAVLVHDIGMALLSPEFRLLEEYTPDQRALMETHTTRGAHLLLSKGGRPMELGAVVALEHHLRPDGGGYPVRRFTVAPHWASRLAGACSAYVSLRAPRPYRAAWSPTRALAYLEEGAGTIFDPEAAKGVAAMVRLAPGG